MEKKWFNIKAHNVLRLAGENVATKIASAEKDEAEAEAANELHADSSADSSPGSNSRPTKDNSIKEERDLIVIKSNYKL